MEKKKSLIRKRIETSTQNDQKDQGNHQVPPPKLPGLLTLSNRNQQAHTPPISASINKVKPPPSIPGSKVDATIRDAIPVHPTTITTTGATGTTSTGNKKRMTSPRTTKHVVKPGGSGTADPVSLYSVMLPLNDAGTGGKDPTGEIENLHRLGRYFNSQREIDQWIEDYEKDKHSFASFAIFIEKKIDEIQHNYTTIVGRPNVLELATCCAVLLKMPGMVGGYRTLLEKILLGIENGVYLPVSGTSDTSGTTGISNTTLAIRESMSMSQLVRSFYARKPLFLRVQELEKALFQVRSLEDPRVLSSLTQQELEKMFQYVQLPLLFNVIGNHIPTELQAQLVGFLLSRNPRVLRQHISSQSPKRRLPVGGGGTSGGTGGSTDDFDSGMSSTGLPTFHIRANETGKMAFDRLKGTDSSYAPEEEEREGHDPITAASICRLILHQANHWSTSAKEMLLCTLLDFLEQDSLKDLFLKFDTDAKSRFIHHMSLMDPKDVLRRAFRLLPNGGESLYQLYLHAIGWSTGNTIRRRGMRRDGTNKREARKEMMTKRKSTIVGGGEETEETEETEQEEEELIDQEEEEEEEEEEDYFEAMGIMDIQDDGETNRQDEFIKMKMKKSFFHHLLDGTSIVSTTLATASGRVAENTFLMDLAFFLTEDQLSALIGEFQRLQHVYATAIQQRKSIFGGGVGGGGGGGEESGGGGEGGEECGGGGNRGVSISIDPNSGLGELLSSFGNALGNRGSSSTGTGGGATSACFLSQAISIDDFIGFVWRFLDQKALSSTQLLGILQSLFIPFLEENENGFLMEICFDKLDSTSKMTKLLVLLEEVVNESEEKQQDKSPEKLREKDVLLKQVELTNELFETRTRLILNFYALLSEEEQELIVTRIVEFTKARCLHGTKALEFIQQEKEATAAAFGKLLLTPPSPTANPKGDEEEDKTIVPDKSLQVDVKDFVNTYMHPHLETKLEWMVALLESIDKQKREALEGYLESVALGIVSKSKTKLLPLLQTIGIIKKDELDDVKRGKIPYPVAERQFSGMWSQMSLQDQKKLLMRMQTSLDKQAFLHATLATPPPLSTTTTPSTTTASTIESTTTTSTTAVTNQDTPPFTTTTTSSMEIQTSGDSSKESGRVGGEGEEEEESVNKSQENNDLGASFDEDPTSSSNKWIEYCTPDGRDQINKVLTHLLKDRSENEILHTLYQALVPISTSRPSTSTRHGLSRQGEKENREVIDKQEAEQGENTPTHLHIQIERKLVPSFEWQKESDVMGWMHAGSQTMRERTRRSISTSIKCLSSVDLGVSSSSITSEQNPEDGEDAYMEENEEAKEGRLDYQDYYDDEEEEEEHQAADEGGVAVATVETASTNEFPQPSSVASTTTTNPATTTTTTKRSVVPPFSLTTLLSTTKSKKESKTSLQRVYAECVPHPVASLITSWRMNTDQLTQFAKKTMPTILRMIAEAYGEMINTARRRNMYGGFGGGKSRDLTLSQVVYQTFLHAYGLPSMADVHLLAFSCAIQSYRHKHLRLDFFGRFFFDESPYAKQELQQYLEFLEAIIEETNHPHGAAGGACGGSGGGGANDMEENSTNLKMVGGPSKKLNFRLLNRLLVPDKENWMLSIEKAQEVAHHCFRGMRHHAVQNFCDHLFMLALKGTTYVPAVPSTTTSTNKDEEGACVQKDPTTATTITTTTTSDVSDRRGSDFDDLPMPDLECTPEHGGGAHGLGGGVGRDPLSNWSTGATPHIIVPQELKINVDHLLYMVLTEWKEEQKRRENHLLDVFRAGDVNGDGKLTASEFTEIVQSIDRQRDEGEILLMFSDALRRSMHIFGGSTASRITPEIFSIVAKDYDLDKLAWSEDGDLRNITNDIEALDATWIQVRKFFIATFEALIRDLNRTHFLRTCEGTGCGCLKCILDGYIGFQRMRKEFELVHQSKKALVPHTPVSESLLWGRFWHLMRQLYEATLESDGVMSPWKECDVIVRVEPAPPLAPRILSKRRGAIPILLFPDTNRVAGKMSQAHQEEVFESEIIRSRFPELFHK